MLVKFVVPIVPSSWGSVTLLEPEREGTFCLKRLFTTCSVTHHYHNPKDLYYQQWHCENCKSSLLFMCLYNSFIEFWPSQPTLSISYLGQGSSRLVLFSSVYLF